MLGPKREKTDLNPQDAPLLEHDLEDAETPPDPADIPDMPPDEAMTPAAVEEVEEDRVDSIPGG